MTSPSSDYALCSASSSSRRNWCASAASMTNTRRHWSGRDTGLMAGSFGRRASMSVRPDLLRSRERAAEGQSDLWPSPTVLRSLPSPRLSQWRWQLQTGIAGPAPTPKPQKPAVTDLTALSRRRPTTTDSLEGQPEIDSSPGHGFDTLTNRPRRPFPDDTTIPTISSVQEPLGQNTPKTHLTRRPLTHFTKHNACDRIEEDILTLLTFMTSQIPASLKPNAHR